MSGRPALCGGVIDVIHAPAEQGQGRCGRGGRYHRDSLPARHRRRHELYREAVGAKRFRPVQYLGTMGRRLRGGIGDKGENPLPQARRERGHRQHAKQNRRAEVTALEPTAYRTPPDVPLDPPAQQRRRLAAPTVNDGGQIGARLPLRSGRQLYAQRPLEPGAGPRGQRLRLVDGHAKNDT